MSTNKQIIDNFFNKNYETLIKISDDYVNKYSYSYLIMKSDEIISEIYLHIIESENRKNKICELIKQSAYTINYKYDNRAVYYIATIIYHTVVRQNNINGVNNKKLELIYVEKIKHYNLNKSDLYDNLDSENSLSSSDFDKVDVIIAAEKIITPDNWYKHQVWNDYHFDNIKYKQLAKKYYLPETTIYLIVKEFNKEITDYLIKSKNKC